MSTAHCSWPALLLRRLCRSAAFGSATTAWEMNSYQDFIRGQFQGVSLSRDGRLTLAPKVDTLFSSGSAGDLERGRRRPTAVLYVATGHRGRVYQVDRAGKSSLLWTAEQPEVFALPPDSQRRALRRHFARRQGLSHRKRQSHRVFRAQDAVHLVAGGRRRMARSTSARAIRARSIA